MNLKEYLKQEDMTAAQFSRKIGVSQALIGLLIKKRRDLHLSTALKIEKYTKGVVKPHELLPQDLWLTDDGKIKT